MILRDWCDESKAVMRECYDRERRHWLAALAWDTTWTWETVEHARVAQGLPGLLAYDGNTDDGHNRLDGWTFSVTDAGTCHIGGLVADSEAATRALLQGTLDAAGEAGAQTAACFVLDRAPGFAAALQAAGFTVEPSHYLSLSLDSFRASDSGLQAPAGGVRLQPEEWRPDDLDAAASLLQESYEEAAGRHFAPDGNWEKYVVGLVEQAGCGVFNPALTRVVRGGAGLQAFVGVTNVSPATAHIAQLAVHPSQRGRGVARALVEGALRDAARAGHGELTLLVADSNHAARALYASLGFTPRATFVAARLESIAVCRRSASA